MPYRIRTQADKSQILSVLLIVPVCGTQSDTMKSPPTSTDDCDDIFGPPRTYATGYCPPKNRPSMISAKYRQKEERRKVLKISINKLKKIEDPEASLCRSVLINNTMKRLQKEARDEKIQKQQLNYPRCYDNDNFLNIKSEFIKNEAKGAPGFDDQPQDFASADSKIMDSLKADFAIESELDSALNGDSVKNMEVLNGLVEENFGKLADSFADGGAESRKRAFDEVEDCDVQDVLSQFYMPPTPRMLTCIDDDEDVNVVDDEPVPKRARTDAGFEPASRVEQFSVAKAHHDEFRVNYVNNNVPETDSRLRYLCPGQGLEAESAYSCGHASMFNELQSNVFHSLIASLET